MKSKGTIILQPDQFFIYMEPFQFLRYIFLGFWIISVWDCGIVWILCTSPKTIVLFMEEGFLHYIISSFSIMPYLDEPQIPSPLLWTEFTLTSDRYININGKTKYLIILPHNFAVYPIIHFLPWTGNEVVANADMYRHRIELIIHRSWHQRAKYADKADGLEISYLQEAVMGDHRPPP